jgi:predicted DCC family thiol-disulfide oxidoreductase YuxK
MANVIYAMAPFSLSSNGTGKEVFVCDKSVPCRTGYLKQCGLHVKDQSTVVCLKNGVPRYKSRAVLEILKDIGGGWNLFYILIVVPPFVRDFIYAIIAKNRYRIFGRRSSCMVPDSEITSRFLHGVNLPFTGW